MKGGPALLPGAQGRGWEGRAGADGEPHGAGHAQGRWGLRRTRHGPVPGSGSGQSRRVGCGAGGWQGAGGEAEAARRWRRVGSPHENEQGWKKQEGGENAGPARRPSPGLRVRHPPSPGSARFPVTPRRRFYRRCLRGLGTDVPCSWSPSQRRWEPGPVCISPRQHCPSEGDAGPCPLPQAAEGLGGRRRSRRLPGCPQA